MTNNFPPEKNINNKFKKFIISCDITYSAKVLMSKLNIKILKVTVI